MILAFILSAILDVHSSCIAINSGRFHEVNPLLPNSCSGLILTQTATTTGFSIYYKKAKHRKIARAILITLITAHTIAAIHNYRIQ